MSNPETKGRSSKTEESGPLVVDDAITQNEKSKSRFSSWSRIVVVIIVVIMVGVVIGTVGVSALEERDQFCIQCHTAPEETYYARAHDAVEVNDPFELVDLSSYHYWDAAHAEGKADDFRCIDCHRGDDGVVHRAETLMLAAGDTITWLSGRADQTVEKGAVPNLDPNTTEWQGPERYNRRPDILNAGCLKCHQDALTLVGFDNHFHNRLPAAQEAYAQTGRLNYPEGWQEGVGSADLLQADETILTCLDCHRTHVQGFESEFFLDTGEVVFHACVQCHQETGRGPLDLAR